ncbi:MAG TPA: MmcQ/YjbR family DNA-binding protein [Bryobacteraceae bacterium]|nr:MmcQ/YjbR family DNA-binding protein [Bryobacteraceae bacterium]
MNIEWVRRHCLSFPGAAETVQWGNNLVFKVAGKIFAIAALEPGDRWLSFKCSPEDYAELVERPEIVPAPYLARASWVALETQNALSAAETERLLRRAYDLVFQKLPKKAKAEVNRNQ